MTGGDLLNKDTFGHAAMNFIPGAVALAPYPFVVGTYFDIAASVKLWPMGFAAIYVVAATAVGLLLESFGGWLESEGWDRLLRRKNPEHTRDWEHYLRLKISPDHAGVSYIRTKVIHMKFDMTFGFALLVAYFGLSWLQIYHGVWNCAPFVIITILSLGLVAYLIWDSYRTAKILAGTRSLLIHAVEDETN